MPNYIVQGSDLSSVANAIRTKGNTSEQLAFPTDFVSAIEALPSGSGSTLSLIGSGTYTLLSNAGTMVIPVSLTGTPVVVLVECDIPTSGTAQTLAWAFAVPSALPGWADACSYTEFDNGPGGKYVLVKLANDSHSSSGSPSAISELSSDSLTVKRTVSTYNILAGDYKWYIWGIAS